MTNRSRQDGANHSQLAVIGSRGIPARYGGYETVAERTSRELSDRGYRIVVSCELDGRSDHIYSGVRLAFVPLRPPSLYFLRKPYEVINDILSMARLSSTTDAIYLLGCGAGFFVVVPKLINPKVRVLVNIDGLEWRRSKFGPLGRAFLKTSTKAAETFSDAIVLDSEQMRKYVRNSCRNKAVFVPNGVELIESVAWNSKVADSVGSRFPFGSALRSGNYWLVVARLEPENNILPILDGFLRSNSDKPLLVVGDFTSRHYRAQVMSRLRNDSHARVGFIGPIYDKTVLNMLRSNSFGYLHGHSVGGTNPSLLEAMVLRSLVLAHDNEFNREVCHDSALYFSDAAELSLRIKQVEDEPSEFERLRENAHLRAVADYSWSRSIESLSRLLHKLLPQSWTPFVSRLHTS